MKMRKAVEDMMLSMSYRLECAKHRRRQWRSRRTETEKSRIHLNARVQFENGISRNCKDAKEAELHQRNHDSSNEAFCCFEISKALETHREAKYLLWSNKPNE